MVNGSNNDRMIQFRLNGPMKRAPQRGYMPGDVCLLRVSMIICLFPAHEQIRTVENGWTLDVYSEDWPLVEKAFRGAFLGNKVFAVDSEADDAS